jgi:hypothetical protein
MDAAAFARASAVGRVGFGIGLLAAPRLLTRAWIGDDADRAGAQVLTRLLGVRDLVIGAGTLVADDPDRRRWLAAAVVADATDLTVTLAAGRALPVRGRILVSLAAAGGVMLGAAALTV